MPSALSAPHFHSAEAAYDYVEARLWLNGPVCPRCGGMSVSASSAAASTRVGVYKCYQCRKPFTVRVGTIFEDSKVPLHVWLQAIFSSPAARRASAPTSFTASSASRSKPHGSCRIASAKLCARRLGAFGADGGV